MQKDKTIQHHKTSSDPNSHCVKLIENEILKVINNPQLCNHCFCSICMSNYELKTRGKHFLRNSSSLLKIDSSKLETFLNMISQFDQKINIKLEIPDICFFSKGQPKSFFRSKNNGVFKKQLTANEKKNIAALYIDRRKTAVKITKSQIAKLANEYTGTHLKYFDSLMPSYRHQTNQFSQKPQSFIFHNNNKLDNNQMTYLSRSSFDEICIVKYYDRGFELLNEKQLRQLLKSENAKSIDVIQTYIKPKENQQSFYFAEYSMYDSIQNQYMFNRALLHVKVEINLITKHSEQYVSLEKLQQYELLLKQIPKQYCLYQNYKLIHYMEIVRDVKISTLNTVWIKDQNAQICFFGLLNLDYDQNQKMTIDVEIDQVKDIVDKEMTDLQKQLLNTWEKMKKKKLVNENEEQVTQQDEKKKSDLDMIRNQSASRRKKSRQSSFC